MIDPAKDREIERRRYNTRATQSMSATAPGADGAEAVERVHRRPYVVYEQLIRQHAHPGASVLDLCCGDGLHSLAAAHLGAEVTASDLAEQNLAVLQQRAIRAGVPIHVIAANAENVPLLSSSFDLLTCAGSLSYVDLERFMAETCRLLRPGGAFVFVDSLNHNPIYRLNRFIHYLRGRRSRSTLVRMPTISTLERIRRDFPDLQISYHGVFSFFAPVLRLFGAARAATWLDRADETFPRLRRYAFKVVGVGHRPS